MGSTITAKRYADAFLQVCAESIGLEQAVKELAFLKEVVKANPQLEDFLAGPIIDGPEKSRFLEKIFADRLSRLTLWLLVLLCEKGRINELTAVADAGLAIYRRTQCSEGTVKTVVPLDPWAVSRIQAHLSRKLKKKIDLKVEIDPSLVGGIQVIVDNVIVDGSVKKRLDELKDKLLSIKVV
jgi:F-type H+-transporting ATPase subunit delta